MIAATLDDHARKHVHQRDAAAHRNAGIARAGAAEADRIQRPSDRRAVQQHGVSGERQQEQRKLHGNHAAEVSLPELQKRSREAAVVDGAVRDALRDAAEHRERTERDDDRRDVEPRDQQRVERAARAAEQRSRAAPRRRSGSPPSRHAAPKTTAASPIIEPTERSMPPVIITGVSASASSPSSTLSRTTSKKLAVVKKLGASAEKAAISSASAEQQDPFAVGEGARLPGPTLAERQGCLHISPHGRAARRWLPRPE